MSEYHTPVLLEESISALISDPSGIYADVTFGGGGHTAGILSRLNEDGHVIAFDRDGDALMNKIDDSRLTMVRADFRFIHNFVLYEGRNLGKGGEGILLDGILADLGVSSHQFDTAGRGFSFRYDAPLDMRMNQEGGMTAADVVNGYPQEGHKFLAKVYQALRIEVNHEMLSLAKFLEGAADSLKPGGRLVVITYHSLEDRMVKNFIKTGNTEGKEEKDMYGVVHSPFRAVNRKPALPDESEISSNTRARSAKLRVAERTSE